MSKKMKCYLCGKDLTGKNYGGYWSLATGDRYLCHPDDDSQDCYVEATVYGKTPDGR